MTFLQTVKGICSRWIDCVAEALVALVARLSAPRVVELVEREGGGFAVGANAADAPSASLQIKEGKELRPLPADAGEPLKGRHAEIILRPDRFVFRPIELPRQAADFLDGVVRSQIDRLTPWAAKDAVFGWMKPVEIAKDRISVTVVATARALVMPFVQAATGLGADSISVSTVADGKEPGSGPIKVFEQKTRQAIEAGRIRRALVAVLVVVGLAAAIAIGGAFIIGDDLDTQLSDLTRRVAERRAALRAGREGGSDTAMTRLERRKHEVPSSVIVMEALSEILPDHTFVTELRVEGNKLQLIGFTRDAPSLIRLIEQSQHFTRATFFAPTTRSPSDPGERFHIEARIEPVYRPRT